MGLVDYLIELTHTDRDHTLCEKVLLNCLGGLSHIYSYGVKVKFNTLSKRREQLPCKVISLGNITVGGTGKTPTAQRLAGLIRDAGYKTAILNRGYKASFKGDIGVVSDGQKIHMSASEAGDEAYLLARSLPGIPVLIGKKRYLTGQYAIEHFGSQVVVLDDAYQHWNLARNLDIVLVDASSLLSDNHVIPRGTLREPLESLDRADVFLLTKVDQTDENAKDDLREVLAKYNPKALIVESRHSPCHITEIKHWYGEIENIDCPHESLDNIKNGQKVAAISGLGRPQSFEQTLKDLGASIVEVFRFPDHHNYTAEEITTALHKAKESGATALITTEKDAVKFPREIIQSDRPIPLYVIGIEVCFLDGAEELFEKIEEVIRK